MPVTLTLIFIAMNFHKFAYHERIQDSKYASHSKILIIIIVIIVFIIINVIIIFVLFVSNILINILINILMNINFINAIITVNIMFFI